MKKPISFLDSLPIKLKPCQFCGKIPTMQEEIFSTEGFQVDVIAYLECECAVQKDTFFFNKLNPSEIIKAFFIWNETMGRDNFAPMVPFDTIRFIKEAHQGQLRYGGESFFYHPIRVMYNVIDFGVEDQDVMNAALMHDVLEDTTYLIPDSYNDRVIKIIKELTKPGVDQGNRKTRHWLYFKQLQEASPEARLIKFADILDNVKTIDQAPASFVKVWKTESLHFVNELTLERDKEWVRKLVKSFFK